MDHWKPVSDHYFYMKKLRWSGKIFVYFRCNLLIYWTVGSIGRIAPDIIIVKRTSGLSYPDELREFVKVKGTLIRYGSDSFTGIRPYLFLQLIGIKEGKRDH